MNKKYASPLRYPGGKTKMYSLVKNIIHSQRLDNMVYVEPFSGGYGIGINLLCNGDMKRFIINDYDYHIFALWKIIFNNTKQLIEFINEVNIDIAEWKRQKEIYDNYKAYSLFEVGCSALFLNRTNYSGILKSGPIGGLNQTGKYKIDCRFDKEHLIKIITEIARYKKQVKIYNLDVVKLIKKLKPYENELFYNFDPPYVEKGPELYLNSFKEEDHIKLMNEINRINTNWIMTYDEVPLIKNLYGNYYISEQILNYSVNSKRKVKELFISNFFNMSSINERKVYKNFN